MKAFLRLAAVTALAAASASAFAQNYTQVNLTANTAGAAPVTDPALVNPRGLSRGAATPWWTSNTGAGNDTLYNGAGTKVPLTVTIAPAKPGGTPPAIGTPSGTIFNGNPADFLLAPGAHALFIFSTLDGTIAGWNPGVNPNAVTKFKATGGSSYTGLTSASLDGQTVLYAANFSKGRVDVFDSNFNPVTLGKVRHDDIFNPGSDHAFTDAFLPRDFAPFNVQAIGNDIVVTYALLERHQTEPTAGPGLGFVDIYSSTGELLNRIEHSDWLNAPWGVALAPTDFSAFSHDLLIAQNGNGGSTDGAGTISVYDLATGKFVGVVENSTNQPLVIPGLWAIALGNGASADSYDASAAAGAELYFTAGPNNGQDGLLGYLTPVAAQLTQGNNQ